MRPINYTIDVEQCVRPKGKSHLILGTFDMAIAKCQQFNILADLLRISLLRLDLLAESPATPSISDAVDAGFSFETQTISND